ncbi:hypothetical protein AMTR_s02209p00003020 [Amborella trichopoda]|uniref:Uncharacterized protein n=1 Tax=Amborella trichopoda TaxID=13333 RepID=U5D171_AMBTC|nr:hypothetical protein AMTR_s02209p00003020 [Amborella trichopoda]
MRAKIASDRNGMSCCRDSIVITGLLRFKVQRSGLEVWFRGSEVCEGSEVEEEVPGGSEVVEGSGVSGGLSLKIGEEVRG